MNNEFPDDEMRALLSAYSMGTLTDVERKRLFEKALGNQKVFNEMLDEETMRATMENPFVKRALKNAIEKAEIPQPDVALQPIESKPNRGVWIATVACLLVATLGLYTFFNSKPATVEMAQAPPQTPHPVLSTGPVLLDQQQQKPQSSAPVQQSPKSAMLERSSTSPSKENRDSKAPRPAESPLESAVKKEKLAEADQRFNAPEPVTVAKSVPAAPPPAAAASAGNAVGGLRASEKVVLALRDEARDEAKAEDSARQSTNLENRAKLARRQENLSPIRLVNRQLVLEAGLVGHLYAYRREASSYIKVLSIAVTKDSPRTLPAPAGQINILLAPQADPELDAIEKIDFLPVRMWTALTVN